VRKEDLWEIFDRWDGRTPKPNDRVHFHTLEDALETVQEFVRVLESNVPTTLEDDRGGDDVILAFYDFLFPEQNGHQVPVLICPGVALH